jgi:hypothetical protein
MRVRASKYEGFTTTFNIASLSEVIVLFDCGGADSMPISELEVYLEAKKQWKNMFLAFKDKDIIPNNLNTSFGEPRNDEDRRRGYFQ